MSTEAKVGAFVIAGVVMLGAAIYFVQTTQTVRGQIPHRTYLRYAGGLEPGASVLFGGIKAGQVTSVAPWSEDPTLIEIAFQVRTGTPLNEKSTARVSAVSVMSSPALSITTGTNEARRLAPGEAVPSQEAASFDEITRSVSAVADSANKVLTQLQTDIPAITGQVQTVLTNLEEISGARNQRQIAEMLTQLNTLVTRESPKIDRITDQIGQLATRADAAIGSLEPLIGNADRTVTNVNETVDALRGPLNRDLAELELTIQQARTLLRGIEDVVRTNDQDIAVTVSNLRKTSENLAALTESVKQRPWSLIRIKQPPDREVPR